MQVSITQFRRDLFALINQALEGRELWITHKGRRLRIVAESLPATRLARLTPLQIVALDSLEPPPASENDDLRDEMTRAWERDWAAL